jgi:hypothetical protein
MPHHPSLEEILEKDNSYEDEWAEFSVNGLSWSVWVSAERVIDEQPEPEYNFSCNSLRSEYGTFSCENVFLNFEITTEDNLKNLEGDAMPLGAFSYYSDNEAIITIATTQKAYDDIIKLLLSGSGNFTVRISIPKWDDDECKCVPITQYQLFFNTKLGEGI